MNQKEFNPNPIDLEILRLIQDNARISNVHIARDLNMAPSAVLERVKKLEQKNIILQYTTRINQASLQQNLLAYIFIKTADSTGCTDTAKEFAAIPQVQEVHHVSGEDCYLVKIRTYDSASLMDLMRNSIGKISNILSTRATIVLESVKEQQQLVI